MQESIKHLDFLITHTQITLDHMSGKSKNPQQFCSLVLLERLNYGCYHIRKLYPCIPHEHQLRLSLGLTIRTIIVDSLISMNMNAVFYDHQEDTTREKIDFKTEGFCNQMLADGLKQAINYLDKCKEFRLQDSDKVNEVFNIMALKYERFIEQYQDDGSKPKLKFNKAPGVMDLFEKLARHADLKDFSKPYDSYVFFSKWDHFGILYYDTIHTPIDLLMQMINKCIFEFTFYHSLPHGILYDYSDEDEFLKGQYEKALEYWKTV